MNQPPAREHHDVWRKASRSGASSGNCVEVASRPSRYVAVRDSKNPDGPVLDFSAAAWSALVTEIKQDMLDL